MKRIYELRAVTYNPLVYIYYVSSNYKVHLGGLNALPKDYDHCEIIKHHYETIGGYTILYVGIK